MTANKTPYKPGNWVRILGDISDAYGEVWHRAGDRLQVSYIHEDGEGLMFSSDLGIHWTKVKRSTKPRRRRRK